MEYLTQFRFIGDEFEDGEVFSSYNDLTKIYFLPNVECIRFENTFYDNENGKFTSDELNMPIETLRDLNKMLIEKGIKITND